MGWKRFNIEEKKTNINNDCFAFEEKRTHIEYLFF